MKVFVDESKERDYLLVAAAVLPDQLAATHGVVRGLVLPGQRRLHMSKESHSRKRQIAAAICRAEIHATVYNAGRDRRSELDARLACLRALFADAAVAGAEVIVIEQDDSLRRWEEQQLVEITRAVGCRGVLKYRHGRATTELLLALPDAIGWCWAKGGDWRRRIEPAVTAVRPV